MHFDSTKLAVDIEKYNKISDNFYNHSVNESYKINLKEEIDSSTSKNNSILKELEYDDFN